MRGKKTLKQRMFKVTILIAVPVFLVLFLMNMRSREQEKRELLQEYQTEVTAAAARVDVLLRMMEETLIRFPLNNPDLHVVAEAKERNNEFWISNQRLLNRINNLNVISEVKFQTFLYFPEQDIFYNFRENEELAGRVKEELEYSREELTQNWTMAEAETKKYFVRILDYNRYFIGMWISCDDILGFLNEGEKETALALQSLGEKEEETKDRFVVKAENENIGFRLLLYLDSKFMETKLPGLTDGFSWLLVLLLIFFAVYIWCIYRWVIVPMEKLRQSMAIISSGNVEHRLQPEEGSSAEFVSISIQFNDMLEQLEKLRVEIYEERLKRQEVEVAYLSRQIQPHFILNTLNTLYNYSEKDVTTVKNIILLISKYYRYVVNVNSRYVKLGQELEHIDNYLALQKIRYPNAFDYEIRCRDTLDIIPIPPFLVESFISNAIKYGRKAGEKVRIIIEVEEIQKFYIGIRISDTGEGFSEDMLDILSEYLESGDTSELQGIGIRNSIERLRLIYGKRASIHFYNQKPHGAVVEIQIAVSQAEESGFDGNAQRFLARWEKDGNECADCG